MVKKASDFWKIVTRAEKMIPASPPAPTETSPPVPPLPQVPEPANNDTTIKVWSPGLRPNYKWGDDTTLYKEAADDFIRNNSDRIVR